MNGLKTVMTKRLIRYFKGTHYTGRVYSRGENQDEPGFFVGFADADREGLPCPKSTSGLALLMSFVGSLEKCCRQSIVALSTAKAEMMALVDAYEKHKLVYKLSEEFGYTEKT